MSISALRIVIRRHLKSQVATARVVGVSPQAVSEILGGEMIPGWEQTAALVTALGGWPADVRPLWEAVHYTFLLCLDPPEGPGQLPAARSESP